MKSEQKVVVVFDSGVGGLTVLSELKKRNIKEDFVYLADSENAPYGDKTKDEVITSVLKSFEQLRILYNFKAIVIACNTASVYTKELLEDIYSVPVYSVIDAAANHLTESTYETADVLATRLTAKSHAYQRKLPNITMNEIGCPSFVPFIESDRYSSNLLRQYVVQEELKNVSNKETCLVILGCTHYPLLKNEINAFYGDNCAIVNPSELLANELERVFPKKSTRFKTVFYLTGPNSHFDRFASNLLKEPVSGIILEYVFPYINNQRQSL